MLRTRRGEKDARNYSEGHKLWKGDLPVIGEGKSIEGRGVKRGGRNPKGPTTNRNQFTETGGVKYETGLSGQGYSQDSAMVKSSGGFQRSGGAVLH